MGYRYSSMKCIIKTIFRHWATSACPEVLSPSYRWPSPSEVPPGNLWRPASVIRRVTHLPAAGSRHPRVEWAPRRPWRFPPPHRLQRVRSKECALFSPPCRQRDGPKKKKSSPKVHNLSRHHPTRASPSGYLSPLKCPFYSYLADKL